MKSKSIFLVIFIKTTIFLNTDLLFYVLKAHLIFELSYIFYQEPLLILILVKFCINI